MFSAAIGLSLLMALAGSIIPAWRAIRVDPITALVRTDFQSISEGENPTTDRTMIGRAAYAPYRPRAHRTLAGALQKG